MAPRCLTLHLLALLVLLPRGSLQPPGDGQEGVPAEFHHLQDVQDHIAQAEWTTGDRRSAAGQLEQLGRADQPFNLQSRLQTAREVLETSQPEVDRSLPPFEPADKNVILMLQYDEAVVASGYALQGKATPRPKFLLQWRENHFQLKAPKEVTSVTITARTKLFVVGHGVVENGRITLGGMSAGELAQAIGTLSKRGKGIHMDKSTKFLQEVSLVSCDVGSGAEGKGFVKELLVQLRNIGLKVGYVSARTVTTYVLPDGTKRTAESVDSEFWSKGDPSHKRKFHLEEDGTLREREYTPKELHMERKAPLEGYRVQHPYQKILSWKDGAKYYKIEDTLVENIIEAKTNKIFSELPGPNLRGTEMQKLLIHTTDGRTNLYPVRKITSLKGLEDNIKEIIQRTLDIRSTTEAQDVDRTLNREFRYFRFKDFVYKMNLFNFYVKLHGTTSNVPLDQSLNKLDYDSMANMKEKEHFVEMAKNWVQGDHDAISNNVNVYDGMAVIATHISEAVRNPRVFITNRLMWDVTSSWLDFRRNCPMAGGGTWPKKELIGLDHIATDNVRDRTLATMKLWLTRKYRNTYTTMNVNADAKPLPEEGAEKLQEVLTELPLQDTAIDYSCRPQIGPLSDTQLSKLQGFEEAVRGKSLQPQLLLKSAEDQQRVQEKIRQVIKDQSPVDRSDYQKINSLEKYNDGLKLRLESKTDPSKIREIVIPGETGAAKSEDLLHSYFSDVHSTSSKINHGLGIYGTLMGFQAASQMFSQGREWEGGISLAQGVHGVTELSGVNAAVNDFIGSATKQAVTKISERLEGAAVSKFTSSVFKIGVVAESIPVLSIAFTAFNIYEDLNQKSAIGYVDAALDGTILITSLMGPEMLPITVALTIIRLGLDPLYHEIKHELDSLPPGASAGQHIVAVLKGIGLAFRDIFNTFVDIANQFNIFHTFSQIDDLIEEHRTSMQLVNDLRTADNYYKVKEQDDEDGCRTVIDFTQGKDSAFGGNLYVELTDHNSMIITIDDPLTSGRLPKEYPFQRGCETMDIILGFGETVKVTLVRKAATFLWIPVKKEDVIGSVASDEGSLHGTYSGNSKPNRFYAIQQKKPEGLHYSLDKYFYKLYGNNGNDVFFLGPQRSLVHGGNGQDVYFVPEDGGDTDICNEADDQAMDLLVINISFSQISARKENNDLKLLYDNNHRIVIRSWFLGDSFRHLNFKSSDGALFKVGKVNLKGKVLLEVTMLDYSRESAGCTVDLKASLWEKVVTVRGSDHNDFISGNDIGNVLHGGKGTNFLAGFNGKDLYILEEKDTCDTISNSASDGEIDIVQMAVEYKNVKVTSISTSSIKVWDSTSSTCVIIQFWKLGWPWQHIIFQTRDFVVFQVSNTTAEPEVVPLIMDFRSSEAAVSIDLNTIPGNDNIMTIIGSPFRDHIIGNRKSNFISGGDGDYLKGGDGCDTYNLDCKTKTPAIINNYAGDRVTDILVLKEKFSVLRFLNRIVPSDLIIRGEKCEVRLQNWHVSENNRHLCMQTQDGITFEMNNKNVPLVYAVDYSSSSIYHQIIDTRSGVLLGATKIIGSPHFVRIWGNEKDNFIDPGSGGGWMSGLDGKDTYTLRKEYQGKYILENFAEDQNVDFLLLDVEFKDIRISNSANQNLLLSAPSSANWTCEFIQYTTNKQYRHLIMRSRDQVWFTVSEETFKIQPLFLDRKSFPTDLHVDLSAGNSLTVPTVFGSLQGRNTILGNDLNNVLIGGKETDILSGLGGNDVLQGSDREDYLSGGAGDDEIHGGAGDDKILGGTGDDVIYPGPGSDTIFGGSGSDTVLFWGNHVNLTGVFVNLNLGYGSGADAEGDLYFSVENVLGTSYDDILIGSDDDNYLGGDGGKDLILTMGGYDVLQGGEGSDIYYLQQATGVKRIDNFSKDQARDLIYFGSVDNEEEKDVQFRKLENDLEITFPNGTETHFLEGVLLKNWFKSMEYRHVSMMFGPMIVLESLLYTVETLGTCVITVTSSTFKIKM